MWKLSGLHRADPLITFEIDWNADWVPTLLPQPLDISMLLQCSCSRISTHPYSYAPKSSGKPFQKSGDYCCITAKGGLTKLHKIIYSILSDSLVRGTFFFLVFINDSGGKKTFSVIPL